MSIEDTAGRDPLLHLAGAWGGTGRYIEEMEQQGQHQLVHSDRLPTRLNFSKEEDFLAAGFTFGEPDPQDPLFRPATLPEGWKREGSDHSMWSYIVDDKGRQRVRVFYKAAWYDRDAFMSLVSPLEDLNDLYDQRIKELPVDDWRTRELWIELLTEQHARLLKDADENESWSSAEAHRCRVRAEACAVQLVKMKAGA
jgi:hypothetical protein